MINLTEESDLQKAITSAEAAKNVYSQMFQSSENHQEKQMFNTMRYDIDKHLQWLNYRLNGLNRRNQ